ncbi:Exc2 family lipoprotein, partial [Shigella sonnei]|uniref:Exc2 family lipoprotein n=2 Tax=Shigella sonnei TaxID=624 RepID=UPI001180EDD0
VERTIQMANYRLISLALTQQRIQQFHSQEFLNSLRGTTQFAGTDYRSKDLTPKKSRLLADTISAVYLDGYEGRQ